MFKGCTSLTDMPVLPAIKLIKNCYANMFAGCTNLISANLPSPILVDSCYSNMFANCSNLSSITARFIEWDETKTSGWLTSVASSRNFYKICIVR